MAEAMLPARVPPHDLDSERALLGGVVLAAAEILPLVVDQLTPLDFYLEAHRVVYVHLLTLHEAGAAVTIETLQDALLEAGELALIGGPTTLAGLVEAGGLMVPSVVPRYVEILKRHSVRRLGIQALTVAVDKLFGPNGHTPVPSVLEVAAEVGETLTKLAERAEPEAAKDSLARTPPFRTLHGVLEATALDLRMSVPDLVPSPIEALNKRFGGGFKVGEFVIVGGASGTAKSALMGWWARHAGVRGYTTGIVSVEMRNEDIGQRILADAAQVSASALRSQDIDPAEWARIDETIPTFAGLPVYLCDEAVHVGQVGRMLRRGEPPLRLVFVDYMQLLDAPRAPARYQEVGLVGKMLKRFAKKYRCTVVGLSSVTPPPPTGRKSKPLAPSMRNLRESRDLEYHADAILMLWQPDREKSERELIIDKGRNGAAEGYRVRLGFTSQYLRFQEL